MDEIELQRELTLNAMGKIIGSVENSFSKKTLELLTDAVYNEAGIVVRRLMILNDKKQREQDLYTVNLTAIIGDRSPSKLTGLKE